jgi:hypothetical protein
VGAGSLLVPEAADAAKYLFRVERSFFGSPQPPAIVFPTPGGAGRYNNYVEPYVSLNPQGNYNFPPGVADVLYGNPIAGTFTLPRGFISYLGNFTNFASTAFPGYTSISGLDYTNLTGFFVPNNPKAVSGTGLKRIVFPTTQGNTSVPNLGTAGNPVTPTTTFGGRYDFSRAGSMLVDPNPTKFGGTMKLFYRAGEFWYQYIYYFAPQYYKAYGSFYCQDPPGVPCTVTTGPPNLSTAGNTTSSGMVTRFLLNNDDLTGSGKRGDGKIHDGKATIATTDTLAWGTYPTSGGQGTPNYGNQASYNVAKNFYLHQIHPFTTGYAMAWNPNSFYTNVKPQWTGYDTNLGGANITVTHVYTLNYFNSTLNTISYFTYLYPQQLKGVTRVVSMVRPRLKHVYQKPVNPTKPIIQNYASAQTWTMKVFFLPEPTGLLLLGAGVGILLGLSRMRRR